MAALRGPGEVQRPVPADTKRLLRCVELGGGEVHLFGPGAGPQILRRGQPATNWVGRAVRAGVGLRLGVGIDLLQEADQRLVLDG